jgi:hypothetical protein
VQFGVYRETMIPPGHFTLWGKFAARVAVLRIRQLDIMKNYFHTMALNTIALK